MGKDTDLIVQKQGGLVQVLSKDDMTQVLKPLTKEIYLFDTYIAGTSHIDDQSIFKTLKSGDTLILRREDNKFDDKAILVLNEQKAKLGYIPEKDNLIFARLMDAGKMLTARVENIQEHGGFAQINIRICLVDF